MMSSNEIIGDKALQQLRSIFDKIDRDRSGTISLVEFSDACKELSVGATPEELTEFIRFDTSDDGELDFDEFRRFYASRLKTVFDEIDTDSSGNIGHGELKNAFVKLGYRATDRELRLMLASVDQDGNDEIDFIEFSNYFGSLPSPSMKSVVEKWASGLSIDTGSDLAPPPLPPPSLEIWKALTAGGIAGIASRTLTAPLEKTKILAQTNLHGRIHVFEALHSIWKKESWRGLFAGNGANCLRVLPFSGLICLAYYNMAKYFPLDKASLQKNAVWRTTAGLSAGVFATMLTHPMDVVRARLTVQQHHCKEYTGIINSLKTIAKKEKLSGLYKGIGPTLMAIAPFIALQQVTYDLLKQKATEQNIKPSVLLFLLCGGLAGTAAQTAVYPLDVARRRMQVSKIEPGTTNMRLLSLLKTLSFRQLFGGLSATYMKVMPAGAISLLVRDTLLGRLKENQ